MSEIFHYKQEEAIKNINLHTLMKVRQFIKTLKQKIPNYEYSIPSEHFNNWCIDDLTKQINFFLSGSFGPMAKQEPKRVTREAIIELCKRIEIFAQNLGSETDTTLYAWDYFTHMSSLGEQINKHFIRRVS